MQTNSTVKLRYQLSKYFQRGTRENDQPKVQLPEENWGLGSGRTEIYF